MQRISNQMLNNTMTYNLNRQQRDMDHIQNSLATGKQVLKSINMRLSQVNNMNIITHSRAIMCFIVSTKYLEQLTLS